MPGAACEFVHELLSVSTHFICISHIGRSCLSPYRTGELGRAQGASILCPGSSGSWQSWSMHPGSQAPESLPLATVSFLFGGELIEEFTFCGVETVI